ncbi:MAG: hypothetical protein P8X61_11345 [Limibacillus sp.]
MTQEIGPDGKALIAHEIGCRELSDSAQGAVEGLVAGRHAQARPEPQRLRARAAFDGARGPGEGLEMNLGVAQFHVGLVVLAAALKVQHQGSAEAIGAQPAVPEELHLVPDILAQKAGRQGQVAFYMAEREVGDGPQNQFVVQPEIPTRPNGSGEVVPFDPVAPFLHAVREHELRVVAGKAGEALQIER